MTAKGNIVLQLKHEETTLEGRWSWKFIMSIRMLPLNSLVSDFVSDVTTERRNKVKTDAGDSNVALHLALSHTEHLKARLKFWMFLKTEDYLC